MDPKVKNAIKRKYYRSGNKFSCCICGVFGVRFSLYGSCLMGIRRECRKLHFQEKALCKKMEDGFTTVVDNVAGISDAFDGLRRWIMDVTLDMGMEDVETTGFSDPKQAACLYEEYSRVRGFGIRQGKKIRNKKGEFVRFTYLCNREGFRDKKWLQMHHRKREPKIITRCGCPAEMQIKPRDSTGKWYVSRFVDNHNHDLLPAKFVEYLPSHRKISDVDIAHMDSMRQVASSLQHGDVNAVLWALANTAKVDDRMFWQYEVRVRNHMCDLFLSNERSQENYKLFGDVLAFDATYGQNKYNLPVIVFSGVNHHNQTCVFGTAMVSCESQASYVWVLTKFL
ncbi:protein FAR1-RELATED SEQUENCE 5-like [Arachis duranensis]|uniref:Protein FAR1-RELATED SEQUENCE 5-like n=1 Tax=Arachis duranensis TaxID=130453 RepID=A0A6P5MN47_ARADU|nr:protein FAR1-RELATED SEQUENCE 5-like [Arachis duranensis]